MSSKLYKRIFGTTFFELLQNGFNCTPVNIQDEKQVFTIDKKYLQDFLFVFEVLSSAIEQDSKHFSSTVMVYAVPKSFSALISQDLKQLCWLRYQFGVSNDGVEYNTKEFIRFFKLFKRNKKYYYYNSIIKDGIASKKLTYWKLNKYYKLYKNINNKLV